MNDFLRVLDNFLLFIHQILVLLTDRKGEIIIIKKLPHKVIKKKKKAGIKEAKEENYFTASIIKMSQKKLDRKFSRKS